MHIITRIQANDRTITWKINLSILLLIDPAEKAADHQLAGLDLLSVSSRIFHYTYLLHILKYFFRFKLKAVNDTIDVPFWLPPKR